MTTHENVNRRYADLQSMLRDTFQAEGRGLVEMTISIQDRLPKNLVWELRSIGHIRNQVVHENLAIVPKYFEPLCKEAIATLKQLRKQLKSSRVARKSIPAAASPIVAAEKKVKAKVATSLKRPIKKRPVKRSTSKKRVAGGK